jgi:hypothetical protein
MNLEPNRAQDERRKREHAELRQLIHAEIEKSRLLLLRIHENEGLVQRKAAELERFGQELDEELAGLRNEQRRLEKRVAGKRLALQQTRQEFDAEKGRLDVIEAAEDEARLLLAERFLLSKK